MMNENNELIELQNDKFTPKLDKTKSKKEEIDINQEEKKRIN